MRVAFITQRCGSEVNGGAERVCREVAVRMAKYWDIEILTTCALDYVTWKNHYPPGADTIDGIPTRRFSVPRQRNIDSFNRFSERLVAQGLKVRESTQERWLQSQGPWAPALLDYLDAKRNDYDAFFYFGYLYAQAYFGIMRTLDKSILIPFCHDEWMINFSIFDDMFRHPSQVVYSTQGERDILLRRFPFLDRDGPVIGTGVPSGNPHSGEQFLQRYGLAPGYVLYLGRIDAAKGCDTLISHFRTYVRRHDATARLVMLGRSVIELPQESWLIAPGFVDEETKWQALAGASVVVMPSVYESLSITVLEGWISRKPALVDGRCSVLVDQCRLSQGGLWYDSLDEFCFCLSALRGPSGRQLGAQGHDFAVREYSWPQVERKYRMLLEGRFLEKRA